MDTNTITSNTKQLRQLKKQYLDEINDYIKTEDAYKKIYKEINDRYTNWYSKYKTYNFYVKPIPKERIVMFFNFNIKLNDIKTIILEYEYKKSLDKTDSNSNATLLYTIIDTITKLYYLKSQLRIIKTKKTDYELLKPNVTYKESCQDKYCDFASAIDDYITKLSPLINKNKLTLSDNDMELVSKKNKSLAESITKYAEEAEKAEEAEEEAESNSVKTKKSINPRIVAVATYNMSFMSDYSTFPVPQFASEAVFLASNPDIGTETGRRQYWNNAKDRVKTFIEEQNAKDIPCIIGLQEMNNTDRNSNIGSDAINQMLVEINKNSNSKYNYVQICENVTTNRAGLSIIYDINQFGDVTRKNIKIVDNDKQFGRPLLMVYTDKGYVFVNMHGAQNPKLRENKVEFNEYIQTTSKTFLESHVTTFIKDQTEANEESQSNIESDKIFIMGDFNDRYDAITNIEIEGNELTYKGKSPYSCCYNWDSSCSDNRFKQLEAHYGTCNINEQYDPKTQNKRKIFYDEFDYYEDADRKIKLYTDNNGGIVHVDGKGLYMTFQGHTNSNDRGTHFFTNYDEDSKIKTNFDIEYKGFDTLEITNRDTKQTTTLYRTKLPMKEEGEKKNYRYKGDKVFGKSPVSKIQIYTDKKKISKESDHELVYALFEFPTDSGKEEEEKEGGKRRKRTTKKVKRSGKSHKKIYRAARNKTKDRRHRKTRK